MGIRTLEVLAILVCLAVGSSARAEIAGDGAEGPGDAEEVRAALRAIDEGTGETEPLAVTYDDLHGLHGGLQLTIRGDGTVRQKAVRERVGEPGTVTREELAELVSLLVELEAWKQRTPERPANPDEGRARLSITFGPHRTEIWEWYNDVEEDRGIGKVRALLKRIAWKAPPG